MLLEIVSPEAKLFSGEITSISLPGVDGHFQMLNNHAPIVSILQKGLVKITATSFDFTSESKSLFTKINDLYNPKSVVVPRYHPLVIVRRRRVLTRNQPPIHRHHDIPVGIPNNDRINIAVR